MITLRVWIERFIGVFRRRDAELDEEIQGHLDLLTEAHLRQGMPPDEARAAARRAFGGVPQTKEAYRDQRGWPFVDSLFQDLRYALRTMRRTPGFTTVTVVTLALGIGANTAIFSVVHGVLLKPLPFPDSEELVGVWHSAPGLNITDLGLCPSMYVTYRGEGRAFEDVGLWSGSTVTVTGLAEPEQVASLLLTEGTLPLLGVRPLLGRSFISDDVAQGSPDVVILAHDYWQSRFGGDPSVVGRRLILNARPRDVIGVLPQTFRFLNQKPAVLLPLKFGPAHMILGLFNYQAVARLKPHVSIAVANADVARMVPIWKGSFAPAPGLSPTLMEEARITPNIRPFKHDAVGDVRHMLWIVMGTIGVVLLIACANVANLFLLRAEGRRQELAVRVVLGAGWLRIARGVLLECLLLSLMGGVLGLALAAYVALPLLTSIGPGHLPRLDEISIDLPVLLFALAISVRVRSPVRIDPRLEVRDAADRSRAPSRRPHADHGSRPASGPGRTRDRSGGARARAADQRGSHDSDVSEPEGGAARVYAA